jgi:hypothetical protein
MRNLSQLLVVALIAVAAGCGGGDSSSDTTSTNDWAEGLCSAIDDWGTSVSAATQSLRSGNLSEDSLKSTVDDVESATSTFVDDVKDLGKPDTEAGQKAKESLDQLGDNVDDEVAKIKDAADDASSGSGVAAAIGTATAALSAMGQQVSATFSELQQLDVQGELEAAFKQADSCKNLGDATS